MVGIGRGGEAVGLEETNPEGDNKKDDPIVDAVAGALCAICAFALLWLNEGHAARMNEMLRFLKQRVTSVKAAEANAGDLRKPVFVTGDAGTEDTLTLEEWGGLTAPMNSAKLRAMCFMLQWEEEKDDNKTTYKRRWVHHQVNSDGFRSGHTNPEFPTNPTCVELGKVTVGGFILSMKMLGKLQNYISCPVETRVLDAIMEGPRMADYSKPEETTFKVPLSLCDCGTTTAFYFSRKGCAGCCGDPAVGDLMVIFQYVACGPVSLLGIQAPVAEHVTGGVFVPGTRCECKGSAAEITEVTPPPRPFQIHYTHGPSKRFEWVEADDIIPTRKVKPWHEATACPWTFVPVQYTKEARAKSIFLKANTRTLNIGDEAGQSLLGENEVDAYIDDVRTTYGHLQHGLTGVLKAINARRCNPVEWARAFLRGSSPDEVCLAYPGTLTFGEAMRQEKLLEGRVNNAVRLFGFCLNVVSFCYMLKPLTWVLSWLWLFGAVLVVFVKLGALLMAVCCSGCTMAAAWLCYRPEIAMVMACGVITIIYMARLSQGGP